MDFESHDCFEDVKTDSAFVEDDFEEEARSTRFTRRLHDGETVDKRGSDKPSVAPSNDAQDDQDNPKQTRSVYELVRQAKLFCVELAYPYFLFLTMVNCTNELWICKPERDGDGLFMIISRVPLIT